MPVTAVLLGVAVAPLRVVVEARRIRGNRPQGRRARWVEKARKAGLVGKAAAAGEGREGREGKEGSWGGEGGEGK